MKKREFHGMSKSRIYGLWVQMMQRCYNENSDAYEGYGARGITVCERWHNFSEFYADVGEKPFGTSLDRIDNDKGYSKENCRWATWPEQAINKRKRSGTNKNNSTGIPGVYWKPSHNKYVARKTINGRRTYVGFFKTLEEASAALLSP